MFLIMHLLEKIQTKMILVNNPSDIPDPSILERVEEPYIKASIITKSDWYWKCYNVVHRKKRQDD